LPGLPIVLKTSESIWLYPVFAFVCYVSIHLENFCDGGASDAKWKLKQESTVARQQSPTRPVFMFFTAIAAAVQMRWMKLDLLFVAKRVGFLWDENRLTWFCRDKEVSAKRGLT
jgi:hypothetical protein